MATNDREKALELAIGQIEKQFGRGAIMKMGEASARMQVEAIPTGSLSLDLALGIGGIPRGRVIEIYGPESAGKSTLAQSIIAQAQAVGGMAAYIDVEHALDPVYAAGRGARDAGGDRGRHGRRARRPAGAADVAGTAQADRRDLALAHGGDLHQPA